MKKKKAAGIICALVLFLFINSNSSAQAFDDGANVIYLGFGLPPSKRITNEFNVYKNNNNFYDFKLKNYGTGVLKYERGLHKYFGLGLNLEYSASRVNYKYGDVVEPAKYIVDIKSKIIGGFVKFNGHFPVGQKLDFYGGVGLGYLYTINNYADTNPNKSAEVKQRETILDFDYQLTLGARFMIKDKIGLFAEVGRATTLFQFGLAFKL
ncbi:MAG TPA: outer membrane beta-barrel protein [Bacteroidia bacterium]|jgi:hypothetical protein|nr:outer membrane beta-barrel protein [Bacteroidia bacterium]